MAALLALGSNVFEISPLNYQAIERDIVVKMAAIARFGRDPSRHHTGFGEDEIRIEGVLWTHEMDGARDAYNGLVATARRAQEVPLIGWAALGATAGKVFGWVVILRVRDRQDYIDGDGGGKRIAFEVVIAPAGGRGGRRGLFR